MLRAYLTTLYPTATNQTSIFNDTDFRRDSDEERFVLENNKFFLAFENQNCSDYITEKFWRSLSYDIIPVVSIS
jgi:hypothetical protein